MAQYLTHGRGKLGLFGISFNAAGAYNFATVDGSRKVTNCINFMDCEGACLPLVFFTFLFYTDPLFFCRSCHLGSTPSARRHAVQASCRHCRLVP